MSRKLIFKKETDDATCRDEGNTTRRIAEMKIPHTINANIFKVYEPSKVALALVPESKRNIKSEDVAWDEFHPPRLTELCVRVIVANFENRVVLNELPCWDRNYLLEILPTDLPLPLVIKHIHDEIYWKRKVQDRWKNETNYCKDYGSSWKRMYLERHVQEAVEAMTPEGFDLEFIDNLCALTKDHVKKLNLRELQILQAQVMVNEDDEFGVQPEPCDHIDLGPIILRLDNLEELHVQFGLRNVGSDYKKSWFQFSVQDCRNLGAGVAAAKNLRLLRVHSCNLDDDRLIALLSSMDANQSLEKIDFSNCLIGDDGVTAVAKFMKKRKNLKAVNLCNNKIQENGISALAFVITQAQCCPLEVLNLKFNMFGDAGFKFLASALIREVPQIKVLNVSCCDLGEESGILMGEVLRRNSTVADVDLSNNHLGEAAGRALEDAMKTNKTIEYLDLRMTDISSEALSTINSTLFFNRIRALKGEKGVKREIRLIEKRAEDERKRLEQEALAAEAAAKAAEEQAARLAARKVGDDEELNE